MEDRKDPALEAVRELARAAVRDSSLRLVAKEIGISHPALSDFVSTNRASVPYGPARLKLLRWAQEREGPTAQSTEASYFRGKQDALMGMIHYIAMQQAEIGRFLQTLQGGAADQATTPSIEQAAAEAEVLRQLPALPPLEKKRGKRQA